MSQEFVLVTGSTGTVGTEVITALVNAGLPVRAAYNSSRSQAKLLALGVADTVQLDMTDASSLDAAFAGVSRAFLLVPFTPQIVTLGTALIDAAQRASVAHVVRLSAFGASPTAPILAGQWHNQLDDHLKASGLPHTILQPSFFMQNFITFYGSMIKEQNALYLPYGDAPVNWVDARDIAAVTATCLQQPTPHLGKTYVVTGGQALSTADIAALFTAALGRAIAYHDIPESAATDAMRQMGTPEILVQALTELNSIAKAGYSAMISPDVETVTGKPPILFSQFIDDYKAAWQ
ncbi:MAG TPA: SDR family oxidoreductase [Chroococcidiopsis sp.]